MWVTATAPTATSLSIKSNHGAQPMVGLSDQLKNLCEIVRIETDEYGTDDLTEERWLEFQNLDDLLGSCCSP